MEFTLNPDGSTTPRDGGQNRGGGGGGALIKESDTARFAVDVIEASAQGPVIVDFWAPWCGPCKQLGPLIEKLVTQAGGRVRLVKVNVDENQDLAAQMRVQSIPAVYGFVDGQPVDGFVGAQSESQVRAFIDRLTKDRQSPLDRALEQAAQAAQAGDAATAEAIYGQILAQDPAHPGANAGVLRAATAAGELEAAREIASNLPDEVKKAPEVAAALAALELAEAGSDAGDVAELKKKLAADENDHQTRFDLALALSAAGENGEAVDQLLELMRRDKQWNDEAARLQLLKIFDALGFADEIAVQGRRKLSIMLFS